MNDVLGIDELVLVFKASERSIAGLKALANCERTCRAWREALLQTPEVHCSTVYTHVYRLEFGQELLAESYFLHA